MSLEPPAWLTVARGEAPLVLSLPHVGTEIAPEIAPALVSLERARFDTDWWVDRLYDFAHELGATVVRTVLSRTVVDVNRDPSGRSLYPAHTTTGLCPTETFDGLAVYKPGQEPDARESERRAEQYFAPYHAALAREVERLRARHPKVVLYDAHSIRSRVPRLFDGELPHFNIGVNGGASCHPRLTSAVEAACDQAPFSRVVDGRFTGGWITRRYGRPADGVHAIQMELAARGYLDEPAVCDVTNWPPAFDPARAAPLRAVLRQALAACLAFAERPA